MKVKVCGMKMPLNIEQLNAIKPDYMGFIFVEESPRFIGNNASTYKVIQTLEIEKVGVFVNAELDEIYQKAEELGLSTIQLHGEESPKMIEELKQDFKVIKAIPVYEELTQDYEQYSAADYFIFDTKGPKRGGNGVKFNWEVLKRYKGETPFFLSGGIGPKDVQAILAFDHPKCVGVDINSRFEAFPGFKKIELVDEFMKSLKSKELTALGSANN